jgi:hypothetical protein
MQIRQVSWLEFGPSSISISSPVNRSHGSFRALNGRKSYGKESRSGNVSETCGRHGLAPNLYLLEPTATHDPGQHVKFRQQLQAIRLAFAMTVDNFVAAKAPKLQQVSTEFNKRTAKGSTRIT